MLSDYEQKWGISTKDEDRDHFATRFMRLIEKAKAVSGLNVVVLVDEYDKPLLNTVI